MEDYEVRQALAIIKDRVTEIKQDEDWKKNIADEWNQVAEAEQQADTKSQTKSHRSEQRSVYSYKSGASKASRASFKVRVADEQKSQASKQDWQSTASKDSRKLTTEDRVAARIANEVLRDNAKLRGVHSGASIQKILQREAKK